MSPCPRRHRFSTEHAPLIFHRTPPSRKPQNPERLWLSSLLISVEAQANKRFVLDVGWKEPAVTILWLRTIGTAAVLVTNVARTRMRDMENLVKQEEQQAAAAAASGSSSIVESRVEGD